MQASTISVNERGCGEQNLASRRNTLRIGVLSMFWRRVGTYRDA